MKKIPESEERNFKIKNGITTRLPNKRITTIEKDGGFMLQFRVADDSPIEPRADCRTLSGKVAQTTIKISDEAAWVLMRQLAEMFGVAVYEKR